MKKIVMTNGCLNSFITVIAVMDILYYVCQQIEGLWIVLRSKNNLKNMCDSLNRQTTPGRVVKIMSKDV